MDEVSTVWKCASVLGLVGISVSDRACAPVGCSLRSTTPPVETQLAGAPWYFKLKFRVSGVDRWFFVDSGNPTSFVLPNAWPKSRGRHHIEFGISLSGVPLAKISAATSGGPSSLSQFPGISGVLGLDFLNQVVMCVEPASTRALFWPSKSVDGRLASIWCSANITVPNYSSPWVEQRLASRFEGHKLLRAIVDSHPLWMLIDTGSAYSCISDAALKAIRHSNLCSFVLDSYDGPVPRSWELVPNLEFCSLNRQLPTLFSAPNRESLDGILALDNLSKGSWIIDCKHSQFAFRAYKPRYDLEIQTPKFSFIWNKGRLMVSLSTYYFETTGAPNEVVSINGKDPFRELGLPLEKANSSDLFNVLGGQLHQLLASPFTLRFKSGAHQRELQVDASVRLKDANK